MTEGTDDNDEEQRPNYINEDSDGDSIPDSVEGTGDLDGDGTSDIPPSGEDSDQNGVDDAYDGKISTDQINKDYIGEDEARL